MASSAENSSGVAKASDSSLKGKSSGVAACTAIVVGNMVGSGFYLSPTAVAPYGNLAIVAGS